MISPEEILKSRWGHGSFRPLQKEIITSVLGQQDTLALLPTGGGKSLCYQLPALAKEGFCLVISPLIALMQDQVTRLKEAGIPAVCLHAGMHYKEVERTLQNAVHGAYKLMYISPERLQGNMFREYLAAFDINLIAVDEAHCISQWGYDFRPDYLKIATIRDVVRNVPVLALTATATREVEQDIINQLQLKHVRVFRKSFKRDNIHYEIRYSDYKQQDTLRAIQAQEGSVIIYCRSRRQTEILVKHLRDSGIGAQCYHAGMAKQKKEEARQAWMSDQAKVMVATTAFGMGIDKADVRLVLHYDAPEHPEAYYQESGRAGRDGKPAKAILLYNHADLKRLQESTSLQFPGEGYLRQVYQSVCEYLQIPVSAQPDRYYSFDLAGFCARFGLQALPASYALRLLEQEGLWTMTEAVFHPATILFTADRTVLDQLDRAYPDLAVVTTTLLRRYGTAFSHPTTIHPAMIARQLKLKQEMVHQYLLQLDKMDILEYHEPKEGAQIHFHHLRVDSRHLLIGLERIHTLRKKHEARTRAMTGLLLEDHLCRQRYLLDYFGEQSGQDCGHCDICVTKHQGVTKEKDLRRQLSALLQTPLSMEQISGSFTARDKDHVVQIIRQLMDEGKLVRDAGGNFNIIESTH